MSYVDHVTAHTEGLAVRGAVPPCGISSGPSVAATPVGVAAMTRRTLPENGRRCGATGDRDLRAPGQLPLTVMECWPRRSPGTACRRRSAPWRSSDSRPAWPIGRVAVEIRDSVGIAVAGSGHWGMEHVRIWSDLGCLRVICDKDHR